MRNERTPPSLPFSQRPTHHDSENENNSREEKFFEKRNKTEKTHRFFTLVCASTFTKKGGNRKIKTAFVVR